jgi:hypothetical protein
MDDLFEIIAREIDEIDRNWRTVLRELSAEATLPARWSYFSGALRWHVTLGEDILESDVDIEVTSTVLIVRARSTHDEPRLLLGLLPVPPRFVVREPDIHIESHTLEILLHPTRG